MRAFVCDACGNRLTPMEEMRGAIYCDNSARRVDCCATCRKAVDRMDAPTCILLARAVLGLGAKANDGPKLTPEQIRVAFPDVYEVGS